MSDPLEAQTAKVDPGWNDPPMLSYDSKNPPPKTRILNKRVPFPLDKSIPSQSTVSTSNLPNSGNPPPLAGTHIPPKPT